MDESNDQGLSQEAAPSAQPIPYLSPMTALSAWAPLRGMSIGGAGFLICRALALWAFVTATEYFSVGVAMFLFLLFTDRWRDMANEVAYLPLVIVYTGVGLFLWFRAGWLSERMTAPIHDGIAESPAIAGGEGTAKRFEDVTPLLSILLILVGIFMISESLPGLVRAMSEGNPFSDVTQSWFSKVISRAAFWPAFTRLIIGIWLLLGPRGIARAVMKLRRPE